MVSVVGSMIPVIFFVLSSVSPLNTEKSPAYNWRCTFCMYGYEKMSPEPELLWVTSRLAVLRARLACSTWCLTQMTWYHVVSKEVSSNNYTAVSEVVRTKCDGKAYCEFEGQPGTQMKVRTSFYSSVTRNYTNGPNIIVKLCPESLPPEPKDVTCLLHGEMIQISWRHEPEECQSYAQYMIQTRTSEGIGSWKWLGEVAPGRHGVPDNDILPCTNSPHLFCTNFTNTFGIIQLKLGVRRMDTNILDKFIAKTDFIDCSETNNLSQLTIDSTESTPSSSTTIMPHPKNTWALKCTKSWRTIAFVLSGALVVMAVLLPLTFCGGMRWQKLRSRSTSSCTSWQHLSGNQLEWNRTLGREELICSEAPPDYTYDYTYSGLMRNQSQLPGQRQIPPTMPLPPLPRGESVEIQNNMYVSDVPCQTRSNRGEHIVYENARTMHKMD